MTVETDYNNAHLLVKRGDEVIHTFEYKEFVPAIEIQKVQDVKNEIFIIYKKEASENTQSELRTAESKYFNILLSTATTNPITHEDALKKFSLPEINKISEEVFTFLVVWSSKAEVKQYGLSLLNQQTEKKNLSG